MNGYSAVMKRLFPFASRDIDNARKSRKGQMLRLKLLLISKGIGPNFEIQIGSIRRHLSWLYLPTARLQYLYRNFLTDPKLGCSQASLPALSWC